MRAFHWYSETPLTLIVILVALTLFAVHEPPATVPHFSVPLVAEVLVAQLTVAEEPTTSVRYG